MLTAKTTKLILKAQECVDRALQTNRLKAWEEAPLLKIKVMIDKFVNEYIADTLG